MRYAFLATLPCLLLIFGRAMANDLGVVGPTYEIAERDLIEVMKDKFRRMEKSGELARLQESYKQRVIEAVEKPRPVRGVSTTETARTFYVDPTWTLDRNVVDEQGKLLFPAGTKVNPLDYAPLTQLLLFFDQREKKGSGRFRQALCRTVKGKGETHSRRGRTAQADAPMEA